MKRKKGDTVTIRKDLKGGTIYGTCLFSFDMYEFTGYTTEIIHVNEEMESYLLVIDEEMFSWTDEMLEN